MSLELPALTASCKLGLNNKKLSILAKEIIKSTEDKISALAMVESLNNVVMLVEVGLILLLRLLYTKLIFIAKSSYDITVFLAEFLYFRKPYVMNERLSR